MKKIFNIFKKETWSVVKEEPVSVTVGYYDSGWPMGKIDATLIFEESNKGNKRYWMKEHGGIYANKPYLLDFETKRPFNNQMTFKN